MPFKNLASKKIKKMKVGYVSKPENIKTFMNHCKKIIRSKKLKETFSKNSKNYLKIRRTSLNQMTSLVDKM